MKVTSSPSRPESCLSDFALDRRLAGELDPREEAEVRAHLDGCVRCAQRWDELPRERETFMNEPLPPQLRAHSERKASRRRLVAAGGLAAMAAAVLLFVRFYPAEETRTKGSSVKLGFYVKHGEHVRLGGPGEHVSPGDALRFVYTTQNARHLAVLSVDGARRASIYYPSGTTSAPVAAGDDVALPVSTVLDDTLGGETIYGVFCAEPFAVEPLRASLEASPDRAPAPAGCVVEELTLRKDVGSDEVPPAP